MDKSAWEKTRSKYHKGRSHSKQDSKVEIPLVSVLGLERDGKISKPRRGDLVIGRIDRSLPSVWCPDLMLDLRGGYVGRCCVTELDEVDDWVNFPLGRSRDELAKEDDESASRGMDVDEPVTKEAKDDEDVEMRYVVYFALFFVAWHRLNDRFFDNY
jgi:hypothetical protein